MAREMIIAKPEFEVTATYITSVYIMCLDMCVCMYICIDIYIYTYIYMHIYTYMLSGEFWRFLNLLSASDQPMAGKMLELAHQICHNQSTKCHHQWFIMNFLENGNMLFTQKKWFTL